MIVYEAEKREFLRHCNDDDIEDIIHAKFIEVEQHGVSRSEIRSWRESLNFMAKVLSDEDIPADAGLAIEFHIPQTSKRVDMTLTGLDANGEKMAVLIELKQWQHAMATGKDAIVSTWLGNAQREVVHPSYQAWSYAALMKDFNEAVYSGGIHVHPCAYLHNYERDGVIDGAHYAEHLARAPVFLKGRDEREKLRNFIKKYVKYGDSKLVLYELDRGRIRPSKALADAMSSLMKANQEFVLIDDQKEAYEAVIAASNAATSAAPRVVLIEGGPGTGKTVLAINLLVQLTGMGLNTRYVSKNAAPRKVYESKLVGSMSRSRFSNLFTGSGGYYGAVPNTFDTLIVDEAHRLNEKSGLYSNLGENQVKELINAASCVVFLIDEDQRIALQDIGSLEVIRKFAVEKGAEVESYSLASQFRCSGSDGYLAWLDNVLRVRETANKALDRRTYEFEVFDSPTTLHQAIMARNDTNSARVVAGYCWPWRSKKNPLDMDIVIGDYQRQWNLGTDGSLWIVAKNSVDQVGCIHTCQGLELDYVGVIIGPDLIVRAGEVVTDPGKRDRRDKTISGFKKMIKEDPVTASIRLDLLIKNTYRTLMTRGMKGCFIYSEDAETREHFRRALMLDA